MFEYFCFWVCHKRSPAASVGAAAIKKLVTSTHRQCVVAIDFEKVTIVAEIVVLQFVNVCDGWTVFVWGDRQQSVAASWNQRRQQQTVSNHHHKWSTATQTLFICVSSSLREPHSITIICLIQWGLLIEFQIAQFYSNIQKTHKFMHPLASYGTAHQTNFHVHMYLTNHSSLSISQPVHPCDHMNNILAIFLW